MTEEQLAFDIEGMLHEAAVEATPWRDPLNGSTRYESSVGVLLVQVAAYSAGVRSPSEECGR